MNRTQSWITIFIVGLLSVIIDERIDMECYFAAYFSFDLTICFLFAFFVSWQLARGPPWTRENRVAIYLRHVKVSVQILPVVRAREHEVGWWLRGATQQALLREHPDPQPPIQLFGLS